MTIDLRQVHVRRESNLDTHVPKLKVRSTKHLKVLAREGKIYSYRYISEEGYHFDEFGIFSFALASKLLSIATINRISQ